MERVAPGVTVWLDGVGSDAMTPIDRHFVFLRDQLVEHAGTIQDTATETAAGGAFDPAWADAADEAAELLRRLILPVGLSAPLDPRAILLGGWQHAVGAHGDTPAGLVKAVGDRRIQELVGKAIEMSTVATAWGPS